MPRLREKKRAVANKAYEKVGNWIKQLPTKVQVKEELLFKPTKYLLK